MKKLTKEEFIEKARKVHGDKYDYSKVEYRKNNEKVCIICPKHGEFWQTPAMHMKGCGCVECYNEIRGNASRLQKDYFIKRSKEIHNNKYDYSKVEYVNNHTKVCIICPIHGGFWQTPGNHLVGQGCRKCSDKNGATLRAKDNNTFIDEANKIHGNKYDYSKVKYTNNKTKVCIICHEKDENGREHGEFWQTPSAHLNGNSCPKCGGVYKNTTKEFCERAKLVHGDKYEYNETEYINDRIPVKITCKTHGVFYILPRTFLKGGGCPKCRNVGLSTDEWIVKFKDIHGDKYDYSKFQYKGNNIKSLFICPEHGEFWQTPYGHLTTHGCPECSIEIRSEKQVLPLSDFIERANEVHKSKYNYSKVKYKNLKDKICIICPEHGEFYQEAFSHLIGNACPKCSHSVSECEYEILEYIKKILPNSEIISRDRKIITPQEIDIIIPNKKIGIEYNGLVWHSEKFCKYSSYHIKKTEKAKENGYSLIQIFEDEYLNHREIVLSKLSHILGVDQGEKVYARKCTIKEVSNKEAEFFLDKNHIQGFAPSTVYLGAFYDNSLIGVMSFKKAKNEKWELNRFASDITKQCVGIAGKLFKYFTVNYRPSEVKTFADRRWTINEDDNLYTKLGFIKDSLLKPDYHYYSPKRGLKRFHKSNFRKDKLKKKYNVDTTRSESEIMRSLGYYKIWDCGLIKYIWRN